MADVDAVVVGTGPNGLAAALTLARAGRSVRVYEGAATVGGGCRTEQLLLPGHWHDVCSAVHPLALASPFFRTVDLAGAGVRLLQPTVAFAHPLDDGRSAVVRPDLADTAAGLGTDGRRYDRLFGPLVRSAGDIVAATLAPLRSLPRHPARLARFGLTGLRPASALARRFDSAEARGLLAGVSAHAMLPLERRPTGAYGLLLTVLAHAVGWPVVEGGSAGLPRAVLAELDRFGVEVVADHWVRSFDELAGHRCVLLDVTPRQLLELAGDRLPAGYRAALRRFRYGPGICKVDWVLSGPVPWTAPGCREAGTVHVGGTFEEVAESEADVAAGRHPDRPFALVVQPGVVDDSRAPTGRHTLWAYCHVPASSPVDMTELIEAQIERFAPGFRDLVVARGTRTARDEERHNPNYVGGDINGGAATLRQTLFRPVPRWNTYRTPLAGVYLCSSSTPPGGGVHGMCGYHAARSALRDVFRVQVAAARPAEVPVG